MRRIIYKDLIENLKNYPFVSIFDLRIIFVIMILSIMIILVPFPNLIQINHSAATNILVLIVGSLSSILGVLIAVILVAFNIMRQSYSVYAFKTFFRDRSLLSLMTIFLSAIIVSFLTLVTISGNISLISINFTEFSVVLFIFSLVILFPFSRNIINSTQSKEKISEIVGNIDKRTIKVLRYSRDIMPAYELSEIDENPIFVLNDLSIRTLNDNDWLTSILILTELESKVTTTILEIIEKENINNSENDNNDNFKDLYQEIREIINIFLIIVKTIANKSIELHQEGVLRNVIGFVEKLHLFCAKNHLPWYTTIELNYFIINLLESFLVNKLENVCKMGIEMNFRVMQYYIKYNLPKEEEIFNLQFIKNKKIKSEDFNTEKTLEWDHISEEYIKLNSEITKKAINLHENEIVNTSTYNLVNMVSHLLKKDMGDLQKLILIRKICWELHALTELRSKEKVGSNFYINLFDYSVINAIESTEDIFKQLTYTYTRMFIILAKNNMLEWIDLNELRVTGHKFKENYKKSPLAQKGLICIIKLFGKLREISEENINENELFYTTLFEQVSIIDDWGLNVELEQMISSLISSFNNYESLKNKLNQREIKFDCT